MSITVKKGGRTIRTGKDYTAFRVGLHDFQAGCCVECGIFTLLHLDPYSDRSFHVHHLAGRGLGGGKRDDSLESCTGLCGKCHRSHHGQG
jgi:hypothetical protein